MSRAALFGEMQLCNSTSRRFGLNVAELAAKKCRDDPESAADFSPPQCLSIPLCHSVGCLVKWHLAAMLPATQLLAALAQVMDMLGPSLWDVWN